MTLGMALEKAFEKASEKAFRARPGRSHVALSKGESSLSIRHNRPGVPGIPLPPGVPLPFGYRFVTVLLLFCYRSVTVLNIGDRSRVSAVGKVIQSDLIL